MSTNNIKYSKVTLENENGVYVVQTNIIEMDIDEIMILLIKPVLLAAGYHTDNISNYIEE